MKTNENEEAKPGEHNGDKNSNIQQRGRRKRKKGKQKRGVSGRELDKVCENAGKFMQEGRCKGRKRTWKREEEKE